VTNTYFYRRDFTITPNLEILMVLMRSDRLSSKEVNQLCYLHTSSSLDLIFKQNQHHPNYTPLHYFEQNAMKYPNRFLSKIDGFSIV
jgi:hypothetical protein